MDEYKRERHEKLAAKPDHELTDSERIELLEGYLVREEDRRRRAETRQRRNLILFAIFVAIMGAVAYALYEKRTTDNSQSSEISALIDANEQRIQAGRQALLDGCRRGNHHLREVINRNVVRPLSDALEVAAEANAEFIPIFGELGTVDYAICRHQYPLRGKPHPPFFRAAPLPKPLPPERSGATGSPADENSPPAAPAASPSPAEPSPPATGENPQGGPGGDPQDGSPGPPGPSGPTGPQGPGPPAETPPPPPAGPLGPVCSLTGLTLPSC